MARQENTPKARILIVDDHQVFRGLRKIRLESLVGRGRVHTVNDATTATAIWGLNGGYEAVVLNGGVEGQSGIEIANELITRHGGHPRVYIFSSSNDTIKDATMRGYEAFHKAQFEKLYEALKSQLSEKRQ
jgi:DNA-binding NtrC family response regulator